MSNMKIGYSENSRSRSVHKKNIFSSIEELALQKRFKILPGYI